jgi:hypothetical protein
MSIKREVIIAVAALALGTSTPSANAAVDDFLAFSGFGTLGAVHSSYDEADFVATVDQPNGVGYSRKWSATPDSDLGAQANFNLPDELSAVVQVLSRYDADGNYRPTLEWANLKYDFTPDLAVRIGRILLPTYEYADVRNVGYSLPWVRVPVEITYASTATHSDGIDVIYQLHSGAFTQDMQLQWGTTTQDLPGLAFTSNRARIAMFSDTLRYGDANLHLVYQQADTSQDIPGRLRLTGAGFSYEPGTWFVSGDSNYTQSSYFGDLLSWYVSAGMRFGRFEPYALYSTMHQESVGTSTLASLGNQRTVAVGVRWDFAKNLDFKLQLEQVTLDSLDDPAAFANLQPGARVGDKAHVISLTLDFLL